MPLLAPEVKGSSNMSKPMPKLIGSQEVQSISQIFFPQPATLCGIISSSSDLVNCPASCFLAGHNPLNPILLVFTCNNRILGPLLGPTR